MEVHWQKTGISRNSLEIQLINKYPDNNMNVTKVHEVARPKSTLLKYRDWRSTHEILLPHSYYE